MWNSKLVLLDEPTAALGVVQTRSVLDLIKRLRDRLAAQWYCVWSLKQNMSKVDYATGDSIRDNTPALPSKIILTPKGNVRFSCP